MSTPPGPPDPNQYPYWQPDGQQDPYAQQAPQQQYDQYGQPIQQEPYGQQYVDPYGQQYPQQYDVYGQPDQYADSYAGHGAPPPRRGGLGVALLWAVVGALVASAAWGGVLLVRHGSSGADLGSYAVKKNLCDTVDLKPFESTYTKDDPTKHTIKTPSYDEMTCDVDLKTKQPSSDSSSDSSSGSTSSTAYLYVDVELHKKSDPTPEFADSWRAYPKFGSDYKVTPVEGVGDEAFLIISDDKESPSVRLAVRDGWVTYSMQWSTYYTSSESSSGRPSTSDITSWVRDSTKATLAELAK